VLSHPVATHIALVRCGICEHHLNTRAMTRVYHARAQQAPQRSATLDHSRATIKKKKPYKILLEAVTQEKKKLHSIVRRRRDFIVI
jgi:hypothetical protein